MASKLKFKQEIKQEEGLLFSTIRSQVASSCVKKGFEPRENKTSRVAGNEGCQKKHEKGSEVDKPHLGRTYTVTQIKKGIEE